MSWSQQNKTLSAVEIRKTHLFDISTSSFINGFDDHEKDEPTTTAADQTDGKQNATLISSSDEIYDSTYLSTENNCLAIATNDQDLTVLDLGNGQCIKGEGHSQSILCVDSPDWDNSMLASGSKDNSIIFWRLKHLKTIPMEIDGEEKEANSNLADKIVDQIGIATGHTHSVTSIAFSHSKALPFLVSVAHDSTLKLWDLTNLAVKQEKGEEIKNPLKIQTSSTVVAHSKDINSVDVSENNKLCLTASMDKTAKLWHIDKKKKELTLAATLEGHKRGVWCARFSKNLQLVATCSGDCIIKLFSLLDQNNCIRTLQDHQFAVLSVLFIDNSTKLVSVDGGGLIKIWDVQKGICEKTEEGHEEKIWSLRALPPIEEEYSSNLAKPKARFATGGADGRLIIWEDKSEELKQKRQKEMAKRATDQQTLSNLLDQDRLFEALVLTLDLDQPFQCLKVLNKLFEGKEVGENIHEQKLIELIKRLNSIQLSKLLDYAAQWNTNTRTYTIAQIVLNCVLKSVHPDQILKLPNIQTIIGGFLSYSIRHYERLKILRRNAAHLDYMFTKMRILD